MPLHPVNDEPFATPVAPLDCYDERRGARFALLTLRGV
jgi:hypothetical protein